MSADLEQMFASVFKGEAPPASTACTNGTASTSSAFTMADLDNLLTTIDRFEREAHEAWTCIALSMARIGRAPAAGWALLLPVADKPKYIHPAPDWVIFHPLVPEPLIMFWPGAKRDQEAAAWPR